MRALGSPGEARGRGRGIALAVGTACISGVAIFLNSYGVKAAPDATVYTTAKNLVAAALLVALAGAVAAYRTRAGARSEVRSVAGVRPPLVPRRAGQAVALAAIGTVGGSVPFVLFFEGLARASSRHAAFVHKTLVVWVALLAVVLLRERVGVPHVAAIALLVAGQALLDGGLAGFRFGGGELLILGATLLWAVEVVVAKRLLAGLAPATVGVARMVLGSALLVGWAGATGRWGAVLGLGVDGWMWALLTGTILAGYVATWFAALALAPAVDVTAVLVGGAVITALLSAFVAGQAPAAGSVAGSAVGVLLVVAGAALVAAAPRLRTVRTAQRAGITS